MFKLHSNDIEDGGRISQAQVFNSFGHSGGNISPQLAWTDAPEGTESFVVMVYDPDAPTGSGWWHWVVSNIPARVTELPTGASGTAAMPAGAIESRTDYSTAGYGGAAPPPGPPHRYIFTVYALKTAHIDVTPDSSAALVGFLTHFNSIAKASITAFYGV
ncbi:MAG: kinase inhibitor [Acidobacteriaceae bacterium]|jgi:Raf kinase inhibitor-like YbhB/YbcL family protein|nr:kinase inhibitor [Acidobacteriaceae bacterium]